jgi:hypothetical protein
MLAADNDRSALIEQPQSSLNRCAATGDRSRHLCLAQAAGAYLAHKRPCSACKSSRKAVFKKRENGRPEVGGDVRAGPMAQRNLCIAKT